MAAEDTSTTLEEIVVTAQFRAQNLQDTPIAITAVNAEMLEARGQTNIAQVAAQAPNVSLRPQPQNGGSGLIAFIRGVGQTDFNYALDPGVGVYIDDVYIPTLSSSLLELIDLDRIEILRGPQGTLAGKNAIGGAIKLFSQKPKGDDTGSLRLSYGSFNEITARAMADIKLSDTVALRVSGMNRSNDGYVAMLDYGQTHPTSNVQQNNTRGNGNSDYQTMGGQNVTAARAALRFTPNDQLEVNLSADYTREKSEAIPTVLIAAGATVPLSRNFNPTTTGKAYSVDLFGANRVPLLVGKNGQPVPYDCHFVPAGPYSCDTGANLQGWNKRFVSYSNFLDGMAVNPQAPYKPYFAVPTTEFYGHGFQGTLNYKLNDNAELVYIGSYRKYNSKFGQDQDASPLPLAQLDNQLDHHAFTSEVRLNMKSAGGFAEGTLGAFYLDQKGTYTARVDLNYVGPTIDFLHGPDTTPSTTKAAFGTMTLHPTEAASVTGGLRFTRDQKDYTYFRSNPDGTPVATDASCGFPFTGNTNCLLANLYNITGSFGPKNRWDWRVVGDYRFTPQFLAYASVSTGYKGGGVNPRPFFSTQKLPFNPETLTTYETGFKSDLLDRRVRVNGAIFFNKYKDIILGKQNCPESAPFPSQPCARPSNIGAADVKGAELEITAFATDNLSFDASGSYLHFKYTNTPDSSGNLPNTTIPVGSITPYTPELAYSVGAQYNQPLGAATVSYRLDGSYQGKVFTTAENTPWSRVDGRFLANAKVTWASEKDWKVALEVQNLFDKYYFQSRSDITTAFGGVTGVPGKPRTYAVSVERKF
ncbi:MAG TPA: TonB-dependent receptor [Steroidobacteraceae bacterium]|nr:TonB-dependent receptor [Steroidobacteraceae bacterium]